MNYRMAERSEDAYKKSAARRWFSDEAQQFSVRTHGSGGFRQFGPPEAGSVNWVLYD